MSEIIEAIEEESLVAKRELASRKRFSGAIFNPEKPLRIMIVGAGGIGSYLAFFLARQGSNITIIDYDTYSIENLAGQLCTINSLGENKAYSLKNLLNTTVDNPSISTYGVKFNYEDALKHLYIDTYDIIINCADSMEVRKELATIYSEGHIKSKYGMFLDGRMTMTTFETFAITSKELADKYLEEHIFSDDFVSDLPCNMKATSHCGAMAAAMITSCINNHVGNVNEEFDLFSVPFHSRINLDLHEFSI